MEHPIAAIRVDGEICTAIYWPPGHCPANMYPKAVADFVGSAPGNFMSEGDWAVRPNGKSSVEIFTDYEFHFEFNTISQPTPHS